MMIYRKTALSMRAPGNITHGLMSYILHECMYNDVLIGDIMSGRFPTLEISNLGDISLHFCYVIRTACTHTD